MWDLVSGVGGAGRQGGGEQGAECMAQVSSLPGRGDVVPVPEALLVSTC